MKLLWTGNLQTVDEKTYCKYSDKGVLNVLRDFPRIQMENGEKVIIK